MSKLSEAVIKKVSMQILAVLRKYIKEYPSPGVSEPTIIGDLDSEKDFRLGFEIGFVEGAKAFCENLLKGT